jgi:dephospho-CoA kinase
MIIAVCGFRGSGKSLFGSVAKSMGFHVFEMSTPIIGLMRELNMETTNESVRTFATDFRSRGGPAAVAKLILPKLRDLLNKKKTVIVIGTRSLEELETFGAAGRTLSVALVSDEEKRFERITKRAKDSDPKTLRDFRWADEVEEKWGLKALVESSEARIENNSTEEEFREKVKSFLQKYA